MSSYHNRIMKIQDIAKVQNKDIFNGAVMRSSAYRKGHKDARHAAAEIALEADARIAQLEEIISQDTRRIT